MRLVTLPGVFSPISDTWLLADALDREPLPPGARVLDLCSGQRRAGGPRRGTRPVAHGRRRRRLAARGRSRSASTRRSTASACDARPRRSVRGGGGRAVRRDRLQPAVRAGGRLTSCLRRGPARAWDAGRDGRALLDRICAGAARHLNPGGVVLLVHSSLLGYEPTAAALRRARRRRRRPRARPARPADAARAARRGLIPPVDDEEVLVVRARNTAATLPLRPAERHNVRHGSIDLERRDLLRTGERAREALLRGVAQDRAVQPAQRGDGQPDPAEAR